MSKSVVIGGVTHEAAQSLVRCPPLTGAALDTGQAVTAAAMFKALGDPVRLRMLSMIASSSGGELCVCDVPDVGVSSRQ